MTADKLQQLDDVARSAVEKAKGDEPTAIRLLIGAVISNAHLLAELFGLSRETIHARARAYLSELGRGGVSQIAHESQRSGDRPAAPSTRISGHAARSVVKSVYDMRIGPVEITFRSATLIDVVNAERAGSKYTHVMTTLRTSKHWPKDATLPDVYSEDELATILKQAQDAMPPLPPEVVNG
jgi:hypothetical protein